MGVDQFPTAPQPPPQEEAQGAGSGNKWEPELVEAHRLAGIEVSMPAPTATPDPEAATAGRQEILKFSPELYALFREKRFPDNKALSQSELLARLKKRFTPEELPEVLDVLGEMRQHSHEYFSRGPNPHDHEEEREKMSQLAGQLFSEMQEGKNYEELLRLFEQHGKYITAGLAGFVSYDSVAKYFRDIDAGIDRTQTDKAFGQPNGPWHQFKSRMLALKGQA